MRQRDHGIGGRVLSSGWRGTGWRFRLTFSVRRMPPSEIGLAKKYKTLHPHPVPPASVDVREIPSLRLPPERCFG
jgi:hypothetical protein